MNAQRTILSVLLCGATFAVDRAAAQVRELPLDRLTPGDVRTRVDSSIAQASVYRDSLLAMRGRRTVRNTLRLYDEMSIAFNTGQIVALLTNVHPDSAVRAAAAEGVRRRSAFFTALRLDPRLYRALLAVDTSQADAETRYYIARVLALYRHDGVDRDSSTRARIAALRDEAVRLEQGFNSILAADTAPVLLADTTVLGGLPGDWRRAQRRGPAGDFQFLVYHLRGRAIARPNALRPYFPYERVRDALFHIADTLFGLQFTAAHDIPVWHPDVEAYRVAEGATPVGIAYLDVHRRPGKPLSNSTASVRLGVRGRVLPRTALLLSLPQPRPGEPVLLGSQDVALLFHEFGHVLENLVTVRPWFGTSGLPAEFDFREVPSIVFEGWGRDPAVLRTFARHYRTGEPLPDSLVAALQQPDETRTGLGVRGLLARARMSLALHERPAATSDIDSIVLAQFAASARLGQLTGESHPEASFTHLVGYEAAYYTYLWSAVIAEDMLGQFKSGLMDPVTARAYRRAVLDPGRSRPAGASIEQFLGRPFRLDAWAATLGAK